MWTKKTPNTDTFQVVHYSLKFEFKSWLENFVGTPINQRNTVFNISIHYICDLLIMQLRTFEVLCEAFISSFEHLNGSFSIAR